MADKARKQKTPCLFELPLKVVCLCLELLSLFSLAKVHDLLLGKFCVFGAQLLKLPFKFLFGKLVKRICLLSSDLNFKAFNNLFILGYHLVEFALVNQISRLELSLDAVGLSGDLIILDALIIKLLIQNKYLLCLIHILFL